MRGELVQGTGTQKILAKKNPHEAGSEKPNIVRSLISIPKHHARKG